MTGFLRTSSFLTLASSCASAVAFRMTVLFTRPKKVSTGGPILRHIETQGLGKLTCGLHPLLCRQILGLLVSRMIESAAHRAMRSKRSASGNAIISSQSAPDLVENRNFQRLNRFYTVSSSG